MDLHLNPETVYMSSLKCHLASVAVSLNQLCWNLFVVSSCERNARSKWVNMSSTSDSWIQFTEAQGCCQRL